MTKSRVLTPKHLVEDFNHLATRQNYEDVNARLQALMQTEAGMIFFDLISLLHRDIERSGNRISPVHCKVILGIEEVDTPRLPYLRAKPCQLWVLHGMLADLNTEILLAKTTTDTAAIRRFEQGFPKEMAQIAAFMDEALDLRSRSAQISRSRPRGGPIMR